MITISPLSCYINELNVSSKVKALHKLADNNPELFYTEYEKLLDMFMYTALKLVKLKMYLTLYPEGESLPENLDPDERDFLKDNLEKLYKVLSPKKYSSLANLERTIDDTTYKKRYQIYAVLHYVSHILNNQTNIDWNLYPLK